ncbi:MAG TPA: alpha/beta hydrolase-fold protein, partial [Polyangiaceae bacterium]|nr:alpha/beta hydrolase-fold protein [Polyangiaceae bacterium]
MLSSRLRASALALLLGALAIGCGDNAPATTDTPIITGGAGSGGGSAGAVTSAGTGGVATAGQTQGGSANGGMSMAGGGAGGSSGGAAGSEGGGVAGAASGAGGASGSGTGGAGSCSKLGVQADPGTDGDGKKQVDGPYKPAPETQMHLNNAPVGTINGMPIGAQIPAPLIYAATKQYPGLNQLLKYEYWIYVPSQYKAGCPAAMMVFQDGMHYVSTDSQFHIPVVFDNLIASGDLPVTIGVFINPGEPGSGHYDGNEYPNRAAQYDRNSPDYVNFLVDQFLTDIVLPKYDIVDDPEGWGISGHSSGGIAAFMAGWYRPEKFRKLFTHDASFSNTGNYMNMSLLGAVDASPIKPLRVYLMSGPNDLG